VLIASSNISGKLGTSFCNTDWIMRLSPVTYQVDASNATNPKLTRTQGGTTDVIAEQIIGFKVGATILNSGASTTPLSVTGSGSTVIADGLGATILPPTPAFYHRPRGLDEIVDLCRGVREKYDRPDGRHHDRRWRCRIS
jgi:hypothetical protein